MALRAFGGQGISPIDGWGTTARHEDQRGSISATGPGPTFSWPRTCPTTWMPVRNSTACGPCGCQPSVQPAHAAECVGVCVLSSMGTLNIFSAHVLSVYMKHAHTSPRVCPGVCKQAHPSMQAPLWCLGRCVMGSVTGVPGVPVWVPECGGGLREHVVERGTLPLP